MGGMCQPLSWHADSGVKKKNEKSEKKNFLPVALMCNKWRLEGGFAGV